MKRVDPRPTVLHVAQPEDGGIVRCVLDLTADQAGRGWRVWVATPHGDGAFVRQLSTLGATHRRWNAGRAPGPRTAAEAIALTRIVRSSAPDVVHLHSSKAGLVGRLVLRGSRPTIFQPNGWSFLAVDGLTRRSAEAWERMASRWAHAVVCVSQDERRCAELAGIPVAGSWRVLPNAVDLERHRPVDAPGRRAARRRLGLDSGPLVVCVGRLCRQKGQDVLVAAWPMVLRAVPGAELVLVGDGPNRPVLERTAPPQVRFAGPRSDAADWLAAADVVSLPSRWEGMSYVLLEAMASGRSVVASDVQGVREALISADGRAAGGIVPPEDPVALAAAIGERLLDPALAEIEGSSARRAAVRSHDLRNWTEALAQLTLQLAASERPAASNPARPS